MLPFAVTKRAWLASLSFSLAVTGAAGSISAAEPGGPAAARLEVNARPSCTSRAELIERIRARSPRVRFTDDGEGIEIRADFAAISAGLVRGAVSLAGADARPSVRRVLGASCAEAADAVALIIAVTLDPTAADREKGVSASEASSVDPAKGSTATALLPNARKSAATVEAVAPNPAPTPDARASTGLALQVAAQALLGPAPKVMPGVALYATIGIERPALWSPVMLLGASHAWRTSIGEQGGTAAFALDAGSVDACPLRLRWGPFRARPCGSVLLGRLSARGSQTRNPVL